MYFSVCEYYAVIIFGQVASNIMGMYTYINNKKKALWISWEWRKAVICPMGDRMIWWDHEIDQTREMNKFTCMLYGNWSWEL